MWLLRVFCSASPSGTMAQGQVVGKCDTIVAWGRNKTDSTARTGSLVQMIMKYYFFFNMKYCSKSTKQIICPPVDSSLAVSGDLISTVHQKWLHWGATEGRVTRRGCKFLTLLPSAEPPQPSSLGCRITSQLFPCQGTTGGLGSHTLECQCPQSWAGRLCNDPILEVFLKHCWGDRESTFKHCLVCIILWMTLTERKCTRQSYLMK